MPLIEIDRSLFQCLMDRWYKLEIEHRGFRAMLERVKQKNPERAADLEAQCQMLTDSLRNDPKWIEFDSAMTGAWATEDDETFLRVLSHFLSDRASAR